MQLAFRRRLILQKGISAYAFYQERHYDFAFLDLVCWCAEETGHCDMTHVRLPLAGLCLSVVSVDDQNIFKELGDESVCVGMQIEHCNHDTAAAWWEQPSSGWGAGSAARSQTTGKWRLETGQATTAVQLQSSQKLPCYRMGMISMPLMCSPTSCKTAQALYS